METKKMKIKDFMIEKITDKDEYTQYVLDNISDATFQDVYDKPWDVYKILNVGESSVREFVFEVIAEIYNIDYDVIYYRWLYS